MSWLVLLVGGVFEIGFTTCLRYTDGFRNVPWTLGFMVCAAASFLALEHATKVIPLGTAYAVWTGIGALGTVVIGMIWFSEPATAMRGALILLLVGSIVGLKVTSGH